MTSEYSDEKIKRDLAYWEPKTTTLGMKIQKLQREEETARENTNECYDEWMKNHSCDCELQQIPCKH